MENPTKNHTILFIAAAAFIFSFIFFVAANSALAAGERNYILPRCGQPGDTSDNKIMSERYGLNDFLWLIVLIMRWLFSILGSVALLMVVWGGFLWLISAGSQERVKEGQTTLTNAVWGIGIILGSWLLVNFIVAGLTGFKGTGAAEIFDRVAWNNFAITHCLGTGASNTGSSGGKSGTTARPAAPTSGAAAPRSSSPAAPAAGVKKCTEAGVPPCDCGVCNQTSGVCESCESKNQWCDRKVAPTQCKNKKDNGIGCDNPNECKSGKCEGPVGNKKCSKVLGEEGICCISIKREGFLLTVKVKDAEPPYMSALKNPSRRSQCKAFTDVDLPVFGVQREIKDGMTSGIITLDERRTIISKLMCPSACRLLDPNTGIFTQELGDGCEAP